MIPQLHDNSTAPSFWSDSHGHAFSWNGPVPLSMLGAFDYLITVNRSQGYQYQASRTRFEFIPRRLREPLPTFGLPLASPDPDVALDLQAALDRVYEEGSYMLRIPYDQPCLPSLSSDDQQWAQDCWATYRAAHMELFQ